MNTDQKILEKSILHQTDETVRIIESYDDLEVAAFIDALPDDLAVLILSKISRFRASRIIEKLGLQKASTLIEKLPLSIAKVLFLQFDRVFCNKILDTLPDQSVKHFKLTLEYPKNTVGARMDPFSLTIQENDTVLQAIKKINKNNPSFLQQVFVVNTDQCLVGFVELKDLIVHDKKTSVGSILKTFPLKPLANMDISVLKKEYRWDLSFSYLPVVDREGIFLGIITRKALEDIQSEKKMTDHNALQAGAALGDLYRIGISSLLQGAMEVLEKKN